MAIPLTTGYTHLISMAKRAAEDQLTKDNDESGRGDTEEEVGLFDAIQRLA